MVTPITPAEIPDQRLKDLPDEVIECWNEAIAENYNSRSQVSRIYQKDVISKIMIKMPDIKRNDIFNLHYLDIEETYRKFGWDVEYDDPAYNENYEPEFIFTKK